MTGFGILLWALAATSIASPDSYSVRSGDSLEKIAKRHGVSKQALLQANSIQNANKLKLGQKLSIPGKANAKVAAKSASGAYKAAPKDTDVAIAKRAGISVAKLHALNPGIDWRRLQIGQQVVLSEKAKPKAVVAKKETSPKPKVAARKSSAKSADRHSTPKASAGSTEPAAPVAAKPAAKAESKFVAIAGGRVNVRSAASTSSAKRAAVSEGAVARILETKGEWRKLQFAGGTAGWVRKDMLAPTSESAYAKASQLAASRPRSSRVASVGKSYDREDLLGFAKRMIGVRYRYGAMSRSATDCSGFTSQVFASQGIRLPRTSYMQATVGKYVPRSELKAGDLVFFRTGRSGRISHVGIYVGSGRFIHASTGRYQVTVDSLGGRYYNTKYVTARRVGNFKADQKSIPYVVKNDEVTIPDVEDEIPVVEEEPVNTQGLDAPIG